MPFPKIIVTQYQCKNLGTLVQSLYRVSKLPGADSALGLRTAAGSDQQSKYWEAKMEMLKLRAFD